MNSFEDVLGHMLARTEDANVKKALSAYDPEKQKAQNISLLASSRFLLKNHIDPTIIFLAGYTSEFFPHATPLIEGTMISGKPKTEKAADIINVICAISPVQCRKCTITYISTSPDNSEATLNCLICGRKSHADCYKDYTVDNAVGIVFLCDPCLTTSETAVVLENISSTDQQKSDQKTEANTHLEEEEDAHKDDNSVHPATNDEICPLYKENSCPHGLTGKRHIDGMPCPYKHPPKCFYHIGKYGSDGCRYSARRCPYYHPILCENSLKLKTCLNKECKKYHLTGTRRSFREPQQQLIHEDTRRQTTTPMWESSHNHEDNRHRSETNRRAHEDSRRQTTTSVWEGGHNQEDNSRPTNQTHNFQTNSGKDNFLEYIHQVNSNMQQMKIEMEKSVRDIIRDTLKQKPSIEQTVQQQPYNIPTFLPSQIIPNQSESTIAQNPVQPQNIQAYQQIPVSGLYPVIR